VSSGTTALELAVAVLDLEPGAEVILPSFTIISCAAAVVRSGATPVVVDADPLTWTMDPDQVAAAITPRTAAILAVHIYGLPAAMEPILALAARHQLAVIEDAAELIGGSYQGRPCGSFGTISTFSFYPNTHITTGEGGMVVCDDPALAERCRSLRNLCFQPQRRFYHEELGWNYRMGNLQAALGLAQLERLERTIASKKAMGVRYEALCRQAAAVDTGFRRQPATIPGAENLYWVYGMVCQQGEADAAALITDQLRERLIQTRPFFWPMHQQPVFRQMGLFEGLHLPVAENLATHGFYLPSGLTLTPRQQQITVDALAAILSRAPG
jgi:perosamine synthetase